MTKPDPAPDDLQVLGIRKIAAVLDRSPRAVKAIIKAGKLKAWRNGNRWETTVDNVRKYLHNFKKGSK